MTLLGLQVAALARASDTRLELHMRRLDRIAGRNGFTYSRPRLDQAEQNRANEYSARHFGCQPGELALAAAGAVCHALRHLSPTPELKASGRCPKLFERKDLP